MPAKHPMRLPLRRVTGSLRQASRRPSSRSRVGGGLDAFLLGASLRMRMVRDIITAVSKRNYPRGHLGGATCFSGSVRIVPGTRFTGTAQPARRYQIAGTPSCSIRSHSEGNADGHQYTSDHSTPCSVAWWRRLVRTWALVLNASSAVDLDGDACPGLSRRLA